MKVVVDTNVILRAAQPGHAQSKAAFDSIRWLNSQGHDVCLVPQVLYEFWVVATRPAAENGLGLSVEKADSEIGRLLALMTLLDDSPGLFVQWRTLVTRQQVQGKAAHDARIVAAMITHGVTHIVTFNRTDFERYPEVTVISPLGAEAGV